VRSKVFENPIFKRNRMLILQPYLDLFTDYVGNSKKDEYMQNRSTRDVTDAS